MNLKFTILPEDEIHAERRDCHRCIVARAIDRSRPGSKSSVGMTVGVSDGEFRKYYSIPPKVKEIIQLFDNNRPFNHLLPMDVELEPC